MDVDINRPIYDFIIKQRIANDLRREHLFDYIVISSYFDKVILYSKNRFYTIAKYYLDLGDALLNQVVDEPLISWINLYCFPKKAYYYFKVENFKIAKCLTLETINICNEKYKNGQDVIFFATIQQRFNLARTIIFSDSPKNGIIICSQCLVDLLSIKYTVDTSERMESNEFDELVIRTLYQITIRSLEILLNLNVSSDHTLCRGVKLLLKNVLSNSQFEIRTKDSRYVELKTFIKLFGTLVEGDFSLFKNEACFALSSIGDETLKRTLVNYLKRFG